MAESVLGFKIDSSQAAHAAVDLDKMTAAAGKAEQAAIKVGSSASKASRDLGDLGPALQKIIGGIDKLNQTSSSIETKLETMGRAAGMAAQKTKTVGDAATASSAELNKLRAEVDTLTGALDKLKAKADKPIPAKMFGEQDSHVQSFRMEVERLTMKYQPLAQATRTYEATVSELNTAHRLGLISSQQLTTQLEKERQSFERLKTSATTAGAAVKAANNNGAAGKGPGSQSFNAANAGYQFQDVAVTAAMGMNPLMIGLQQGTQLASVVSSMERPVAGLATAFLSLVSPVSLITIGLTAGAAALIQYFTAADEGSKKFEERFAKQLDLIQNVATKWGDAYPALKAYADELARAADQADIQAGQAAATELKYRQLEGALDALGKRTPEVSRELRDITSPEGVAAAQAYLAAMTDVRTAIEAGKSPTEAFARATTALGTIVEQTGSEKLKSYSEWFDQLAQKMREAGAAAQSFKMALPELNVLSPLFSEGGKVFSPEDFVPPNAPTPERRPLIELEGLPGDKKQQAAENKDENLYKRSIEAAREQVEQMKLQAQTAGEAGVAADTFRFKLDLLQKAFKDGKEATAGQRSEIDQLAESYRTAAQAAADARFASDMGFNARQSQRSGRDQQIASQLKGYGYSEDLNSPQAAVLRQQMQWKEAKDAATSFGQTFSSTLVSSGGDIGKSFAASLQSALERETSKLWDRVFDGLSTMFANWLTGTPGTGGATAGAGLGAVAGAFTGKAANDNTGYTAPVGAVTRSALASPSQISSLMSYLPKGKDQGHITGMSGDLQTRLSSMLSEAPKGIASDITINSGFRSVARQKELFDAAVAKYGSVAAARKWVAPPGNSQHNFGRAADLGFGSDAARDWTHQNAAQYGLKFPMANEPWHIETATARGGADTAASALEKLAGKADSATQGLGTLGGGLNTLGQSLTAAPAAGGAGGGGFFGWLGSLFKPAAAATPTVGANANGTNYWRGGLSMVGERGPELLNLPQGSGVVSNHKLMEAITANQNSAGGGIAGVRVFMDDDMKLHAKVESIAEKKAQQTSRQNLGSYKQNQQRSGVGSDQKAYNSRKG